MSKNKVNVNETAEADKVIPEDASSEILSEIEEERKGTGYSEKSDNDSEAKIQTAAPDSGVSNFYDWIKSVVFALVIVIFCLNFFFRLVDVKGSSMEQTLQTGDKLIVTNFNYTPKPNDVVVISHGREYNEPIVKRVIATAGQTLKLDYDNDRIIVDGIVIDEPYLDVSTFCNVEADYEIPEVIPDGMIFVMGDNRGVSMDSRDSRIGLINVDNVIGKAQFVVYPFSEFKYLY